MTQPTKEPAVIFDHAYMCVDDGRAILDDISLSIEQGTTTAFLGRSGSGKTTLLRVVNRLADPSGGKIIVGSRPTTDWDAIALRRSFGYVIQETGLFPHFTAARNVGLAQEIAGRSKQEIQVRVQELFKLVGLEYSEFGRRLPHELSGSQRQRIGLARALDGDPELLLMDEPFGALDPLTRAEMQEMLRPLLQRLKKTVLLVTHDLDEALYLASRIVLIDRGKVVADLPSADFLSSETARY